MQLALEAEIEDKLAAPLEFEEGKVSGLGVVHALEPPMQPDLISAACRAPPPAVATAVQVGAVTQQIVQLRLAGDQQAAPTLFHAPAPPLIPSCPAPTPTPRKRSAAPLKSRAASVPVRHSARQAALNSAVPVAQRVTFRLVQELGGLGPKERMTVKAAEALVRRFNEPLTEEDVAAIARLTRLNVDALRAMAGLAGADGGEGGQV